MNIYEALANVMRDCTAVGKDGKNPQQGYKYRSLDAVTNAVNPALTKNRVFVAPEVLETSREERTTDKGKLLIYSIAKVRYTFYAEDGTSVTAVVIGEGMDSGDKSMNKAMSAAFKYALFQVLCIPTEEMIDSEVGSPEPQAKAKAQTAQAKEGQTRQQATQQPEKQQRMEIPDATQPPLLANRIGEKEGITLSILLKEKGVNIDALLKQKHVKCLADLTGEQYASILRQLDKPA